MMMTGEFCRIRVTDGSPGTFRIKYDTVINRCSHIAFSNLHLTTTILTIPQQTVPSFHNERDGKFAFMPSSSEITQAQQISLDDTDCYASVWGEILAQQQQQDEPTHKSGLWGGRGKGGRGLGRRTVQPKDVVLDNVKLQYLKGAPFLDSATIKLLHGHVYSLIGKNGCGKSSLLKRMDAQKIPGWSTSWSSIYIPPELHPSLLSKNPVEVVLHYYEETNISASASTEKRLEELSKQMDQLDVDEEQAKMEAICEEMSMLEEQLQSDQSSVEHQGSERN
jgi:uncharacterized coiled-coil protein SlyX